MRLLRRIPQDITAIKVENRIPNVIYLIQTCSLKTEGYHKTKESECGGMLRGSAEAGGLELR